MAGAVELNPDKPNPLREIAYYDANLERWRAGPKAPGYQENQFIKTRQVETRQLDSNGNPVMVTRPAGNVGRSYTNRTRANMIKGLMRRHAQDPNLEDLTESEARQYIHDKQEELKDAIERGADREEINQIQRDMRGSP